jgi:hypothetical protein
MKVMYFKDHHSDRCDDEPESLRCTDRLVACTCPSKTHECVSSKFDQGKHNKDLPKFYVAQH